ncbi:Hsp20/alpha crystallin family protein [bacterium]|jgi:HSP20 family protein|nr:Hsp20/alpha crystallin family protein [bacterium]MBT4122158.1 Hsp20/alpha crystallin family protein [bacterium]MBT4335676.1 Hsp20/alpha crystallin family protein [bacterium]MBT4495849.1 Hsp20/alpha crystallin family protein [bacterium]MBT4763572.1 Hsp20/alpha crystallin family protein [bacterium]
MKIFTKGKSKKKNQSEEEDFFLTSDSNKETEVTTSGDAEDESWMDDNYEEGQLSVDVFQTDEAIVIKSTIAGVKPEDIDIAINNDMVTIRGRREFEHQVNEDDYFYQECYWGGFSRSIILPVEIKADRVDAALKNGVLTVTLPKVTNVKAKSVSIKVKEDK